MRVHIDVPIERRGRIGLVESGRVACLHQNHWLNETRLFCQEGKRYENEVGRISLKGSETRDA